MMYITGFPFMVIRESLMLQLVDSVDYRVSLFSHRMVHAIVSQFSSIPYTWDPIVQ